MAYMNICNPLNHCPRANDTGLQEAHVISNSKNMTVKHTVLNTESNSRSSRTADAHRSFTIS